MNLSETKNMRAVILGSWQMLCEYVMQLDEESALYLMNQELKNQERRASIIRRCYSRYSYLRSQRERKQLDDYIRKGTINGHTNSFEQITKFKNTKPGDDRL
jgi:hypothetical protein